MCFESMLQDFKIFTKRDACPWFKKFSERLMFWDLRCGKLNGYMGLLRYNRMLGYWQYYESID